MDVCGWAGKPHPHKKMEEIEEGSFLYFFCLLFFTFLTVIGLHAKLRNDENELIRQYEQRFHLQRC